MTVDHKTQNLVAVLGGVFTSEAYFSQPLAQVLYAPEGRSARLRSSICIGTLDELIAHNSEKMRLAGNVVLDGLKEPLRAIMHENAVKDKRLRFFGDKKRVDWMWPTGSICPEDPFTCPHFLPKLLLTLPGAENTPDGLKMPSAAHVRLVAQKMLEWADKKEEAENVDKQVDALMEKAKNP